ncbi:MAG: EamA family transporter [Deltaproteobacteria bacterium]|nr:MAG: EamA family transporter [Deltaproteobacteria bacterium]
MTAAALLLAVGTSLAWAGFDATRKALTPHVPAVPLVALFCLGQVPFFALWLAIDGVPEIQDGYAIAGVITVVLNIAANLLFVRAVFVSPLSVTIPLLSLTPVFTALIAMPLVGEFPLPLQWVGILAVVGGAFCINAEPSDLRHPGRLLRSLVREKGALFMGIVALLWSVTSTVDKLGMERSSAPLHALVQVGGVAAGMLLVLAFQRRLASLGAVRKRPGTFVATILLAVAALGLQLLAYALLFVSIVEAIKRAIGMTAALVIGRISFGERIGLVRIVAVLVMGAGTALILLAEPEEEGTPELTAATGAVVTAPAP